jgi:hypothetical protein
MCVRKNGKRKSHESNSDFRTTVSFLISGSDSGLGQDDWAAVQNALKESFSNGPVEGHINRLKTLKREMYGRAGFELLRARLLPSPVL